MPEETKPRSKHTDALKAAYETDTELRMLRTTMRMMLQMKGASIQDLEGIESLVWLSFIDGAKAGADILATELDRKIAEAEAISTSRPN